MKNLKRMIPAIIAAAVGAFVFAPTMGLTEATAPIFKDYQVVEVRLFEVPLNVAAPDSAGRAIADETVYQIRRYSAKFNLFEMVIMEGTQKVPPGKKVLLVKGTVTAYSPKGTGTCAVHCQFVDKASGQALHETEAKGMTFRVAEYIAKVIYQNKVGK
ncbi:MAG: hypothetical protein A2Y65_03000 [Deltaproteobacteria bacterium RBG_13_52_11]|nr:MAG: hypothetical protein A2Y65_03000 [Deltaproteobacteria bacterium RBG_13_52_11]